MITIITMAMIIKMIIKRVIVIMIMTMTVTMLIMNDNELFSVTLSKC